MSLVKDYSVTNTTALNFKAVFNIPDNCNYSANLGAVNVITVQLMKGQTVPSSTYVPCLVMMVAANDALELNFDQILNGVTSTRPRIIIENC